MFSRALIAPAGRDSYYEVVVDAATGKALSSYDMTEHLETSGWVFTEHPDAGGQVLVPFYDDSFFVDPRWPLGWLYGDRLATSGLDPDGRAPPGSPLECLL